MKKMNFVGIKSITKDGLVKERLDQDLNPGIYDPKPLALSYYKLQSIVYNS